MQEELIGLIANKLQLAVPRVKATVMLLDEGATIPFIARYRKERTESLDELQIGFITKEYENLQELVERKQTILKTIEEQGALTDELKDRIEKCWNSTELEDIYLPYKPHRKTRADVAREKGLQPLADKIFAQQQSDLEALVTPFIKDMSREDALQGARDIIAEQVSQDERARNAIRREFGYTGRLTTRVVKEKLEDEQVQKYQDYFTVNDKLSTIPAHRLLAIRRAENEGFIRVDISPEVEKCIEKLSRLFVGRSGAVSQQVALAVDDAYKRLLKPSIETEYAASSKLKADEQSIKIFADNAHQLLLDAPLGTKRVLALDPGFRTGCKMVCLSEHGDLLYHDAIYPHSPIGKLAEATEKMNGAIEKYNIEVIAIGNGTASRETERFVGYALEKLPAKVTPPEVFVVSEDGASIYSASKVGRDEFPDEDVTVRGAVSIGRRLQDPLAELVKIDPKSIGVGQYQHDVDQALLKKSLVQTVESVVNYVGVELNTASVHLLSYVSGIGTTVAQNIVQYRSENGAFKNRQELLSVPKLGAKTFEQSAGFLRVANSKNPLDNSAVHPEAYKVVETMAKDKGVDVPTLMHDSTLQKEIDINHYVNEQFGVPTLKDIMHELSKPSRDPRQQKEPFHFDENVHTIDDLQEGMILPGIVTNLSAFGAFVDIGVHQDGLIHISQMVDRRIQSPSEVLTLHQQVKVRVIGIDIPRHRISLSLKGI